MFRRFDSANNNNDSCISRQSLKNDIVLPSCCICNQSCKTILTLLDVDASWDPSTSPVLDDTTMYAKKAPAAPVKKAEVISLSACVRGVIDRGNVFASF